MAPMRYVVIGGTGFIGRRVVSKLLQTRPDDEVGVLIRRTSLSRFEHLASDWGERVKPVVGDLTAPDLGLTDGRSAILRASSMSCTAARSTTSRWRSPPNGRPTSTAPGR